MLRDYAIVFDSKGLVQRLGELSPQIQRAAANAINKTAIKARTLSARRVLQEVNFPASYVAPAGDRLTVRTKAGSDLEARVVARSRPTSLARFATGKKQSGGVRLQVKPGKYTHIAGAFLIKLRSGSVDTNGNLGLALRTADGRPPRNAYAPTRMKRSGLWLLYGPSVAQALLSANGEKGIWPDLTAEIRDFFESEFIRQKDLKL